jgi:hypothetical protein
VIRGPDTLGQLRARLRRPVHVLHVLCHGDLDHTAGEGVLIFEDTDGEAEPVNAELLRLQFQKQRGQTKLVLLNACLGALPAGEDPFGSVGVALQRAGVPAVVAMQFEIADDAAAELARVFYAELAAGMSVDLALTEARLHLYGRYRTRLDWAIPVLFLRADDGVLFMLPDAPAKTSSDIVGVAPNLPTIRQRAGIQRSASRQSSAMLPSEPGQAAIAQAQIQFQAGEYDRALGTLETLLKKKQPPQVALALLAQFIEHPETTLALRLRAADLAGQRGDARPGVCTLEPAWCVALPAGDYPIAGGKAIVHLNAFRIARYPVTVWQYRQFVAAGGYDSEHEHWWTLQGRAWRRGDAITSPFGWDDPDRIVPNKPVGGVSWYEAAAFCEWLTRRGRAERWLAADQRIRLPSEAEWEVAAMWDAQLGAMAIWEPPAGSVWQNSEAAGLGRSSPVGAFPTGASPCGALDMAGNVWEWCASSYNDFPPGVTPQKDFSADAPGPALRGGSYLSAEARASWPARLDDYPQAQVADRGLRVCISSADEGDAERP